MERAAKNYKGIFIYAFCEIKQIIKMIININISLQYTVKLE
jgi:hypothetical protein